MQAWQLVLYPVVAIVAVIGLGLWIAGSRSKPGGIERKIAKSWLLFRRLLCFSMAALCVLMLGYMLITGRAPNGTRAEPIDLIIAAPLLLVLASFLVWVGIHGRAKRWSTLDEDRKLDEERKKRYGWRP
jgi:hypothetical protein